MKFVGSRPVGRQLQLVAAGTVVVGLLAAACGGSSGSSNGGGATAGAKVDASKATSAADFGGMDALVAAAKKEGQLNVITLPPDWANYGEIISSFTKKYGIKINSANPDGSSADEITAVKQLKGQSRAPDVLDVGNSFALQATSENLLAPYQVATWKDIDSSLKDPDGKWFADYGGYVSIGYDSKVITDPPTSFADLKKPEYKGKVAINGDPTQAGAAFAAVMAASLANGGSFDDIMPGIQYFADLRKSGNFVPTKGTPATVQSGETPILLWWDYLNAGSVADKMSGGQYKINIPTDSSYASYYDQAINATAPHPAAARLWEEYLYSDEGQNLWLKGRARPIRLGPMTTAGTVDKALLAALPTAPSDTKYPTNDQLTKAQQVLADNWAKMVGGA
ncbi:ABC transporter substrate-binding protein [Pseudofrankia sp. DC12]|uniref:ABC transporter substrate-binding protein n=1 Tax=Pseudofrankia sp. DC12 TaxID=683315 RepID=UPI0009FE7C13|nr:ABC transporter substrate-binding protein [Pseudofrankia sp. DC12]